jgi:hypothetical protein
LPTFEEIEKYPEPIRRLNVEPIPAGHSVVFLAFKHNRNAGSVAARLKRDLGPRLIYAYRAIDDPHPGWLLQPRLDQWIAVSDGVVILWSQQGSASPAVVKEYDTAKSLKKRLCLVKFPDVREPHDWSGEEWLPLDGVTFGLMGARFWEPAWSNFVDTIASFAHEARGERRGGAPAWVPRARRP